MTINRNSAEFKQIKAIFDELEGKTERRKLIQLYAQRKGEVKKIPTRSAADKIVYDLTFDAIVDYLRERSKKLVREGDRAFYFFRTGPGAKHSDFPFELRGRLKKLVSPFFVRLKRV